ncbi:MAG: glycine cleavage system aminomethyltransferase GcvT [Candidatus Cryptobacteroides sp.]|nr:glycine cleavage system aminomethyltransferase GcvT [Candidatus Cryptobacteroides sp.]
MEEKKTCLYDSHIALGANMSPFGGFIMPIQYSSIEDEHRAVRNAAGMFDVSHMGEILVSGKDSERFVNHIFTNDISVLPHGGVMYGMMLREDGGTVDDLMVYRQFPGDSSEYLLVVNAANIGKDFSWLLENASDYQVKLENVSDNWGEIAIQGPDSQSIVTSFPEFAEAASEKFYTFRNFTYDSEPVIVSRTGYTGEDGFEIYASPRLTLLFWNKLLEMGVKPCGLGCRDTLRFEAALPLYGHELGDDICPIEAGLGIFVKTDKTEFIGREAALKMRTEGPERKLVGVELLDRAIPRAGYAVLDTEGRQVGEVTTGYRSITLDRSLCMAYVDASFSALDTPLQIAVRKKVFPAKVVKKRFYTPKYKK